MINSYKDLIVSNKAIDLVIEIYNLTSKFPRDEIYGLTSQMRRAAVSIIAEGKMRGYKKECKQFFLTAFGSGGELETQVLISKRLYADISLDFSKTDALLTEIMKMLNTLISNLEPRA